VWKRCSERGRALREGAVEGWKGQGLVQKGAVETVVEKGKERGDKEEQGEAAAGCDHPDLEGVAPKGSGMAQVNIQSAKSKDLAAVIQSNAQTQDSGSTGVLGGTGPTRHPHCRPQS